jgi:hypothetical protein
MLAVRLPKKKLDPVAEPDEVVDLVIRAIIVAEKAIPGLEHGPERLEAVSQIVRENVKLGWFYLDWKSKLITRMVYGTVARGLPENLRSTPGIIPRR